MAESPHVKMSEVNELVEQVLDSEFYGLDDYGLDINSLIEDATTELMPCYFNIADENNFRLALRAELEEEYDRICEEEWDD